MKRLPKVSGKEVVRALTKANFERKRQTGSHLHLVGISRKTGEKTIVTVPIHANKVIPPKTLLSILRQAGITKEEFNKLL